MIIDFRTGREKMTIDFGTGTIDLNFYPEKELAEQLDLEVPQGWAVVRFLEELQNARLLLWSALNKVDDDGNVVPTWK